MIEEARIKRNLESIAFPRLSGTVFELEAFNIVKQQVEDLNLKFEVQNFTFSSFYSRIYPKIAFLSISLILLLVYLNIYMNLFFVFIVILLGLLSASFILTRKPEKIQFIKRFNSQNLLVKLNPTSNNKENNGRTILFMSHLDSKGQRFKINTRIRIIKLWISSSIILTFVIIFKSLIFIGYELILYIIGVFPLIANMIVVFLLLINTTDNSSFGAVDNASGVSCNLELVHYYSFPENRLQNYNLWFLFTGAEECGTMGVKHFYNDMAHLNPDKLIIFNFESIARDVFLFPGENDRDNVKNIDSLLLNNSRNLMIRHYKTNRVFGTHSDGGFLGDKGLFGFGIGEVEAYDYMHTPRDTVDKIETKILEKLCLVLTDALKENDSKFIENLENKSNSL